MKTEDAAKALEDAKGHVADVCNENEYDLRELARQCAAKGIPTPALNDIFAALKDWRDASQTFAEAIVSAPFKR